MKVTWSLKGMDTIKNKHLEANAAYWKYDMLLNAQKVMHRVAKSRTLKAAGKMSGQLQNMISLVENKANLAKEDINQLADFTVKVNDDKTTTFTIFVSDSYFSEHDVMESIAGRRTKRYLIRTKIGRQQLIDNFEKEIRSLYTKKFSGRVLEDDGKNLSVMK